MQRKQFLVKMQDKNEGDQFIQYLKSSGCENIHNISYDTMRIKVVVINDKVFFTTNATCLAALAQAGVHPMTVADYMSTQQADAEECNIL